MKVREREKPHWPASSRTYVAGAETTSGDRAVSRRRTMGERLSAATQSAPFAWAGTCAHQI